RQLAVLDQIETGATFPCKKIAGCDGSSVPKDDGPALSDREMQQGGLGDTSFVGDMNFVGVQRQPPARSLGQCVPGRAPTSLPVAAGLPRQRQPIDLFKTLDGLAPLGNNVSQNVGKRSMAAGQVPLHWPMAKEKVLNRRSQAPAISLVVAQQELF